MNKTIKFKDKKFIWHPFTKTSKSYDPIVVSSAVNEKIFDIDGNEYIDLIASWWVNIHGHCKKEILTVINKQLKKNSSRFYLLTSLINLLLNLLKNYLK